MADKERKGNKRREEPNPEFENFRKVLERVLSVPKEELDERRAGYERGRKGKRAGY